MWANIMDLDELRIRLSLGVVTYRELSHILMNTPDLETSHLILTYLENGPNNIGRPEIAWFKWCMICRPTAYVEICRRLLDDGHLVIRRVAREKLNEPQRSD